MDLHREFENSRFFHQARIERRAADELIGMSAGLIADGTVNQQEAEFLKAWIETNLPHLDDPVVNLVYRRLANMLSDGILQPEESRELLELLHKFTGPTLSTTKPYIAPTTLPLCNPAPHIIRPGRCFLFTGTMAFGARKECEAIVQERGGVIGGSVSKKVHYLVVGSIGNEQWLHSSYGTKIMKAVELRDAGAPLSIISETHWQESLFG